jgi:hypothetical protein
MVTQGKQLLTQIISISEELPAIISSKKLADLSIEEIKQPVRYALALCGIRPQNFPTELQKTILVNFIRRHYGDYSPAEIAFAFDLAMARKLPDLENPSCFENFCCEYIGRVLAAYEKWNPGELYGRNQYGIAYSMHLEPHKCRQQAEAWFQRFKAGEHIDFIPSNIYWILHYDRYIKPIPEKREYPKYLKVMAFFEYAVQQNQTSLYTDEPHDIKPKG